MILGILLALLVLLTLLLVVVWMIRTEDAYEFVERYRRANETQNETMRRLDDQITAGGVIDEYSRRKGEDLVEASHRVVSTAAWLEDCDSEDDD